MIITRSPLRITLGGGGTGPMQIDGLQRLRDVAALDRAVADLSAAPNTIPLPHLQDGSVAQLCQSPNFRLEMLAAVAALSGGLIA